jgi:small subunit ribosomal protein S7
MARRRAAVKREILPDPKYNDLLVGFFINSLMKSGKKSVAERILYGALDALADKEKEVEVLDVFKKAVNNVRPSVEVKSRRVGGSTYQVPIEVRSSRSQSLAIRWIIGYANKRHGKSLRAKLADELLDAYRGRGSSVKKKEDTHKMADANKAFAHYRW